MIYLRNRSLFSMDSLWKPLINLHVLSWNFAVETALSGIIIGHASFTVLPKLPMVIKIDKFKAKFTKNYVLITYSWGL